MLELVSIRVVLDITIMNRVCSYYPFVTVVTPSSNLALILHAHTTLKLCDILHSPYHSCVTLEPGDSLALFVQLCLPLLECIVTDRPAFSTVGSALRFSMAPLHDRPVLYLYTY